MGGTKITRYGSPDCKRATATALQQCLAARVLLVGVARPACDGDFCGGGCCCEPVYMGGAVFDSRARALGVLNWSPLRHTHTHTHTQGA